MVLRIFVLCFALLLIASLPLSRNLPSMLYRCAGGDDDYVSRPAFLFQPQMADAPEWEPLYFTWNKYYGNKWDDDTPSVNSNIAEWKQYFGNAIPASEISPIIYQAKPIELLDIYVKRQFNKFRMVPGLENNRLVQQLVAKPDTEFLTYILFAKECEPYVTDLDGWEPEESINRNRDTLMILMNKAEKLYASCKSDFLKLRYGYQTVRLARYAGEFEKCEELYNTLVPELRVESIIRYWALEQKAGAIRKLKRAGESAYLFSLVFGHCPDRRNVAFMGFRIPNDTAWNDCIRRCKTNHERETVYFLRAIDPHNSALDELKSMYSIDPTSEYLTILLSREVNKIEERWYDDKWYNKEKLDERDKTYLSDFAAFLDVCANEKKVGNPDLWNLARAHVRFMNHEPMEAATILAELQKSATNKLVRNSLPSFEITYKVLGLKRLDQNDENVAFKKVLETNNNILQRISVEMFQKLLEEKGDTVRAYLCSNDIDALRAKLDLDQTEAVIRWWNKPRRTNFDDFLVQTRFLDHYSDIAALYQIKAAIFLGQHRLQDAKNAIATISADNSWISRANPFHSRITDCRDCEFAAHAGGNFDRLILIDSLLLYESSIKTDPKNAARYHYLLGNAYYNITYFGNSAEAAIIYRDPNLLDGRYLNMKKDNIPYYLDCSFARRHYTEAMKLAESSGDFELAAECCFLAAKCDQNEYYVTVPYSDDQDAMKNKSYRTNFARMKERYSKTKFYLKAIDECKYFNYFVSK